MLTCMVALLQEEGAGGGAGAAIFGLLFALLVFAGLWKVFAKAGQPGWAAIIPIYNSIVLLRVAGRPWWWLLLMLIPLVNFIVLIIVWMDIAKAFGKGVGFGLGLIFLSFIFVPILGFGDARYGGPAASSTATAPA